MEITREDMDVLIKLQSIETESGKIRSVLDRVEDDIADREKRLKDAELHHKTLSLELADIRKNYKELEDEMQSREDRLAKSQEYLKNVTTNTEYQTLLREIDDNKKKNAEVETQMIEILDTLEAKEKEVADSQSGLDKISEEVSADVAGIRESSVNERKELEAIVSKRDEIAKDVKPKLLDRFNKILKQSAGLALVPVVNEVCKGCYMNVPPQQFIEIQRGESLNFCPHCHRMLYYSEN